MTENNETLGPLEEGQKEEVKLENKSTLLKRQKELEEENEKLLKEMQERTYPVDFGKVKIFNKLMKFLEKDAPWGHTTASGLIMLYHNLRTEKDAAVKTPDWDGIVSLRAANVSILWQMLTKMTGTGFYEARDFVELMVAIGESISESHNKVVNDNGALRENHGKLALVDQALDEGQYIDDMPTEVEDETPQDEGKDPSAE